MPKFPKNTQTPSASGLSGFLGALQKGQVKLFTAAEGRIAVVESEVPGALLFGYLKAPVVVALHPAFPFRTSDGDVRSGRKFTICQWAPGMSICRQFTPI